MITIDELRRALAKVTAPGDTEVSVGVDELFVKDDTQEVAQRLTYEISGVNNVGVPDPNNDPNAGRNRPAKVSLNFTVAVRDDELDVEDEDEDDEDLVDDAEEDDFDDEEEDEIDEDLDDSPEDE
jgi:hypothetical protein